MDCSASALVINGEEQCVEMSLSIAKNGNQSAARAPPYCASDIAEPQRDHPLPQQMMLLNAHRNVTAEWVSFFADKNCLKYGATF